MKKLTNAMIRHHLITIAVVFAAALTLGISAPASAQQYSGDQGSRFQDKDYDFNYRERTGGSREQRYMPRDQEYESGRDYDYGYGRAADDDYDWRYRERYGGSREQRYMPDGRDRGPEPETYSRQGMGADQDYDWRYRERFGGSREQRYMPRGDQRQGQQEEWSLFDEERDRRSRSGRREYTGGSRDQRYMPRDEEYQRTRRDSDYDYRTGDRTGGSRDQRYSPGRDYEPTRRDYDYQARERTGGSRSQRFSPQQQGQWKLTPQGWVRIGYDLDDDGNFDTYEYISYYDLKKARESSEQKMRAKRGDRDFSRSYFDNRQNRGQGRSGSQQQARSGRSQRQDQGQNQSQGQEMSLSQSRQAAERWKFDRINGTIEEMKTIDLTGMDEPHSVARLKLDNGRMAKVDLGPKGKVEEYDLKTGDTLIVFGTSGRINDRSMLMAHWLEFDNRVVSIRRPQDKNMRRYKAEVVKTKNTKLKNTGDLLMARVKFEDGRTTIINLGPSETLKAYNVKPGVEIDMLTRPVNIDGKRALVAEQLVIGDKVVDINWEKVKNLPKQGS